MADASRGPVSTLPGASIKVTGKMCDDHPDRPATVRIQGETDSFGCEYHDLCQECADKMRKAIQEERETPQTCDWCKKVAVGVAPMRDVDEGQAGPVYHVCPECRSKYKQRWAQEYENYPIEDWDY